jgi:hypothetical protein
MITTANDMIKVRMKPESETAGLFGLSEKMLVRNFRT